MESVEKKGGGGLGWLVDVKMCSLSSVFNSSKGNWKG